MTTAGRPFLLGRFSLEAFIAQGGMGRVWRALTAGNDTVAIKVLRPDASDRKLAIRAFRREIHAVARLRHRGIVPIFDFGEVSDKDAQNSAGRIEAGSPYLVMQYVDGPSLSEISGALPAEELRRLVLETLAALAHSHARGIIHRDLKPSNILLAPSADGTPPSSNEDSVGSVRLTDFGIAHALEDRDAHATQRWAHGTPGFMAPEQVQNQWRDFGPWTDLYALGRMVEDFLARAGAVGGELRRSLARWLDRMCAESWSGRFERASDAARVLGECDFNVRGPLRPKTILPVATETTMVETSPGLPLLQPMAAPPRVARTAAPAAFEVAADWRQHASDAGVPFHPPWGLGLYALRPRTVVARERERDLLWSVLADSARDKRASVVFLRGKAGVGKSFLARWLCELAHESGVAEILRTSFSERPDPRDGIGSMLAQHFRTTGLPRASILGRIEPALRDIGLVDPTDWLVLTELIADQDDERQIRFGSERERNRALLRFFTRSAQRRPLIVWFDDLQWSRAARGLVAELQRQIDRSEARAAIVCIATVRDDAATEDDVSLEPPSRVIDVEPLAPNEHKTLVRSLLALEDSLAARIEDRSDGNPLFAEQILGDLIARGVLEHGESNRFRLKTGARLDLPDELRTLWTGRVAAVTASTMDLRALELAAALGTEVNDREWRALCAAAGVDLDGDLSERLLAQGLAEPLVHPSTADWRFVHSMIAESLEHGSREAGRFIAAHEACAALLSSRPGAIAKERVGRHLLAAGAIDRAAPLLLEAAVRRHNRGEFRDAHFLLAEREAALARAEVADSDPRRVSGWMMLARCCRTEGELDEARDWARRATVVSQKEGRERTWCQALLVLASVARLRGENEEAHEAVSRARQLADRVKEPLILADCYCELAWIRQARGDSLGARPFFLKCLALVEELEDDQADPLHGSCLNGLAHGALQNGDTTDAMKWLRRALVLHERFGSPTHRAYTLGALGDAARAVGQLDEAEERHRQAHQLLAAVGYGHLAYTLMNLGLVELDRRRYDAARTWFLRALNDLLSQGNDPSAALPHAMITPCCVARGEWEDFDRHLADAKRRLMSGGIADVDIAEPLRLAGELAVEAGEADRSRAAYELSLAQFRELGRDDKVADVETALAALSR